LKVAVAQPSCTKIRCDKVVPNGTAMQDPAALSPRITGLKKKKYFLNLIYLIYKRNILRSSTC
jgi:hypothetical protein